MRSLLLLVVVAACGKGDKPPPPSSNALLTQESGPSGSHGFETKNKPAASKDDPATIYRNRCAMCHGNTGKGDGISAGALAVKPRDYTDAKWQEAISDEAIKKIIVVGGAGVGRNPSMPPHSDLSPEALDGLVKIIRGFGGK